MKSQQTRYEPGKEEALTEIKDNLKFEYSDYLDKLTLEQLREITRGENFQLMYRIKGK